MKQDFSFWEFDTYHHEWDVCIIGSGITGLSTGISLLERKPELNVLILDRWFIPLGASTRNAGFACFGSPSEIMNDISRMGEQDSIHLVGKRWKGLQKLKSRLDLNLIQYESNGGYELYHEEEFEDIKSSIPYLNELLEDALGVPDVFRESKVPEGISGFTHAIFNPLEGQLHPAFMIEQLKQIYLRLGGKLWTGFNVETIEDSGAEIMIGHPLSLPIIAQKLVITTNAFINKLLPDLDIYGARNHVLVTEPVQGLAWEGCYHYDKGFYYFRNIGQRVLLGGARNQDLEKENTSEFGSNPHIIEALKHFLYEHLVPEATRIRYQWSGIIDMGTQKAPILKAVSPRLFVGVRLSGMGIALASLIGEELTDLILQQED
jgi:glycine/D-amino acid oxidase-like deaminating enzyme